ncbi:MAG: hypothetical protein QG559_610 [Campylobacterota bacterium]|nr:hypothetical protein [Campylobacterota bacterium]
MLKNETLIHLLEKLTMLHDLADKKAYMALSMVGAVSLVSPQYIKEVIENSNSFHNFWQFAIFIAIAAFLIVALSGAYFAIRTLLPRTNSSGPSIVFWGNAANKKVTDLQDEWSKQTDDELIKGLVIEYHSNAQIASQKFKHAKSALYFASAAIALFFIIAMSSLNFKQKDNNHHSIEITTVVKEKSNDNLKHP